jgi:hypothetical protein
MAWDVSTTIAVDNESFSQCLRGESMGRWISH